MHSISDALLLIIFNATGILFPEKEVYLRKCKINCLKYIMRYCCWLFSNKAPQYKNRWEYNRQQRLRLAWACLFVCSVGGGAPVGSTFLAAHAFCISLTYDRTEFVTRYFSGRQRIIPESPFWQICVKIILFRQFLVSNCKLLPNIF